jgi:hypothetical protein
MKLFNFITGSRRCPICDNPLSLCLQIVDDTLFLGSQRSNGSFLFQPFRNIKNKRDDDTITLTVGEDSIDFAMSSNHMTELFGKSQFFTYYICNIDGFSVKDKTDPAPGLYESCYYKASPIQSIVKEVTAEDQVIWKIKPVAEAAENLVIATEQYAFKKSNEELTKAYMVSLDHEEKKTLFWHYAFTPEQEANEDYEPKIFEKVMPLLPHGLKMEIENRENLFSKFESWILMS